MNFFTYFAVILLTIFSIVPPSNSQESSLPHTQGGYSSSKSANVLFPNYYILVDIGEQEITDIFIEFPSGLQVRRGISIINNNELMNDISYTIGNDLISIKLSKPISKSKLKIALKGIKNSENSPRTKLFYLTAGLKNSNTPVPFGTVLIKSY